MSQLGNALKMLVLLQSKGKMKITQISQEIEVDERSIRRYRDDLGQAGIYIYSKKGKYGGYILADNNYILNMNFNNSELYSLQLVENILKSNSHFASKDVSSVVNKMNIAAKIKNKNTQDLASHMEKASHPASNSVSEKEKLLSFHAAILQKKKVYIKYSSLTSGMTERVQFFS
jgi:predicted DNA-binding transcriptional regulator YafY